MKIYARANNIWAVAEAAGTTQDIELYKPTVEKWLTWLHSEHSMIRCFALRIEMSVPYYVHVHLVRHKIGCEWFVRSQRPTAINPVRYDRNKAPQSVPVRLMLDTNPQALINISQVRLCEKADEVTRGVWYDLVETIANHKDPYVSAIARVMKPRCEYRGGVCHELKPCGQYPHYKEVLC